MVIEKASGDAGDGEDAGHTHGQEQFGKRMQVGSLAASVRSLRAPGQRVHAAETREVHLAQRRETEPTVTQGERNTLLSRTSLIPNLQQATPHGQPGHAYWLSRTCTGALDICACATRRAMVASTVSDPTCTQPPVTVQLACGQTMPCLLDSLRIMLRSAIASNVAAGLFPLALMHSAPQSSSLRCHGAASECSCRRVTVPEGVEKQRKMQLFITDSALSVVPKYTASGSPQPQRWALATALRVLLQQSSVGKLKTAQLHDTCACSSAPRRPTAVISDWHCAPICTNSSRLADQTELQARCRNRKGF